METRKKFMDGLSETFDWYYKILNSLITFQRKNF